MLSLALVKANALKSMDITKFQQNSSGRIVKTLQGYFAFVPNPLPPQLNYTPPLITALSEADRNLATLAGVGRLLPNPHLLVAPYMRREAVLSSRIEGTQTSLSDLFIFEAAPGEKPRQPDVREVFNYVRALDYGLKQLPTLPLSLRLVRELHSGLLRGVRGEHGKAGDFRTTQNWIGPPGCTLEDAVYVPPPVSEVYTGLDHWEKFAQRHDPGFPPLVQCGLLHYQFEAIHPFVDGNGRVGRLLIILFLCERGLLPQPLLYLSAFFEKNRDEYYDRLLAISQRGDWDGWLLFFLRGVATQSQEAVALSERILTLHQKYRLDLQTKRAPATTLALLDEVFVNPYLTIPRASTKLKVSYPTAQGAINRLVHAGVLKEVTARRRNRIYCAVELLQIVQGGDSQR